MTAPEKSLALKDIVVDALKDIKGMDILTLDVEEQTDITDFMVIATGKTNRQVKALTDSVIVNAKAAGYPVNGVEGGESAEWVLIDLCDVICHVMLPKVRDFYEIERLWSVSLNPKSDGFAED